MKTDLSIKKRTGQIEGLDIQKIHKVVNFACEGLAGVSSSLVQMNAGIQFSDGMTTKEIQDLLIRSANDLITLECPTTNMLRQDYYCTECTKKYTEALKKQA